MTTTISIEITDDAHVRVNAPVQPPIRRHVQVPGHDRKTNDWWEIQRNPSASVRMLIEDEIARFGMVDRVTRSKFGTAAAVAAAPRPTAASVPASVPAQVPAPQAPQAVPTTSQWTPPLIDPRDAEIERLTAEAEQLRADKARLEARMGPLNAFLAELEREETLKPQTT